MAPFDSGIEPLSPRQWFTCHNTRKARDAQAKLPISLSPTDYLMLAPFEFVHVPRSEHKFAAEEICFGRSDPDKKISWERDYDRGLIVNS